MIRGGLPVLAAVAAMQNSASACEARLFFDLTGNGGDQHAAHPGMLAFENPTLPDGGGRLYIYWEFASSGHSDHWYFVNYDITVDGGLIKEALNYQPYIKRAERHRWQDVHGNPAPNPATHPATNSVRFTAVSINAFGLTNDVAARAIDQGHDMDTNTTILGYVDVAGGPGASVWTTIGELGMGKLGGCPTQFIFMGFGDDPVFPGGAPGRRTTIPEATIVPEPTGLVLLAVGMALIKRSCSL